MKQFFRTLTTPIRVPARFHFWGGFAMILLTASVMSSQIGDRWGFANADLRRDVMERWGAPIDQAAPSVRFAESGSVFNSLQALAFESQKVRVSSLMNYRKRGLVYFSGFEFDFDATYVVTNSKPFAIDVVFIFPVQSQSNRILLSDLAFYVGGETAALPLDVGTDKLVWTGRLAPAESQTFAIRFRGQGLDRFTYRMDPELPVRGLSLTVDIIGGDNYDYDVGIVPAHEVVLSEDNIQLSWHFDSLESGVPVGVSLPSETSFDSVIVTMTVRAWATFVLFFMGLALLTLYYRRDLALHESYLAAAIYSFYFVLLPYLAAYMNFYVAFVVSGLMISALLCSLLVRVLGREASAAVIALVVALLIVPTTAVVFQEHTGLIYSLEILGGLLVAVLIGGNEQLRSRIKSWTNNGITGELIHADD